MAGTSLPTGADSTVPMIAPAAIVAGYDPDAAPTTSTRTSHAPAVGTVSPVTVNEAAPGDAALIVPPQEAPTTAALAGFAIASPGGRL